MSAGMRSRGIGVGCGSIYGAFERKEDARSRDRSSAGHSDGLGCALQLSGFGILFP